MLRSIIRSAASARAASDVGDRVKGHDDVEVADVGVQGRVQHALLGHLPAQRHPPGAELAQQVGQRGLVEEPVVARLRLATRVRANHWK